MKNIKVIEKELALHKEKLKISQSLVKIGFWQLNRSNKTILLTDEAMTILKLKGTKKNLKVREFCEVSQKNERELINIELNNLIEKKSNLDIEFSLEQSNSEEPVTIRAIAKCSIESQHVPNTIMGIVQDISEQKNAEIALKKAKEKAEEADFLKSAFLANMSHEIRTPLNAILGFSRLLTSPALENEQRKEYSEYITSSANNLLNLIRDIIDVSKIEAGKIIVEKSKCLVNKILKELKFTYEREKINQSKNHIDLILRSAVPDENFAIFTDPFRFHQILVNLIGNALKFIENGFIEFGYVINSNKHLQFYVKDTGIGIPKDKIGLIFSRFGQIIDKKIKNPGGTGLGLSITKHLVERLGGKIWVETEEGKGTTFYFTLPFEQLKSAENIQETIYENHEKIDIKEVSVLAVEDDPINMILLEDTLKMHLPDIKLSKARDGIEALELLKNNDFDLIFMDIRMPRMNGYIATEKIRNEFPAPKNKIPILGLSAHALNEEIEKGRKLGMTDFMSKPIRVEELLSKIKKLTTLNPIKEPIKQIDEEKKQKTELKSMDISFFIKLFKNDEFKIQKTLKEYKKQVPQQLKMLKIFFERKQAEKLKTIAHSLKSTFKYIGRQDLSDTARNIEVNSDSLNEILLLPLISKLEGEWEIINDEIDNLTA